MVTFDLNRRPGALTPALGLGVDIVGYGCRPARVRQDAQQRLLALMRGVLGDVGIQLGTVLYGGMSGDSMSLVLPPATDPTRALPGLLMAASMRFAEDNERYRDRIRVRMGLDFGLAGRGPLGLVGNLIVDLDRLTDNPAIRQAVVDHLDADVVALISNRLHGLVAPIEQLSLKHVEVIVKEYAAPAWLWTHGDREWSASLRRAALVR
ncbi:hypothetical protein [Actinophytocola sp.]|uniref:hypothetical protein n=1 Tax=Actinophytocola sp. TaxID=1872138 RepID=UPI002ED5589A